MNPPSLSSLSADDAEERKARLKLARRREEERKRPRRRTCFDAASRLVDVNERRKRRQRPPTSAGSKIKTPGMRHYLSHMTTKALTIALVMKGLMDGLAAGLVAGARGFVPKLEVTPPVASALRPRVGQLSFAESVRERVAAHYPAPTQDPSPGLSPSPSPRWSAKAEAAKRVKAKYGRADFPAMVFRHIAAAGAVRVSVPVDPAIRRYSSELADWLEHKSREQFEYMEAWQDRLMKAGDFDFDGAAEKLMPEVQKAAEKLAEQRAEQAAKWEARRAMEDEDEAGGGPRLKPKWTSGGGDKDGDEDDHASAYEPDSEPEYRGPRPPWIK